MELAMMEMKNEMAAEREVFHREKDKWRHQMKRLQHQYEQEKSEFERQKYILMVSWKIWNNSGTMLGTWNGPTTSFQVHLFKVLL